MLYHPSCLSSEHSGRENLPRFWGALSHSSCSLFFGLTPSIGTFGIKREVSVSDLKPAYIWDGAYRVRNVFLVSTCSREFIAYAEVLSHACVHTRVTCRHVYKCKVLPVDTCTSASQPDCVEGLVSP